MVLSTLIFLPILFALVLVIWPQKSTIRPAFSRVFITLTVCCVFADVERL